MLTIRFGQVTATWGNAAEEWLSDDALIGGVLQTHYNTAVAEALSPSDAFLKNGISGKVWTAVKKEFGDMVKLILLEAETAPKELPGVYH